MSRKKAVLDVREDIRRGREPFSTIMRAVAGLRPDEDLVLVAPFAPTPLYAVLGNQGFQHSARELESGDWEILFSRGASEEKTAPGDDTHERPPSEPDAEVDVLKPGKTLQAHTERRPMHLFAHLEERGCTWTCEELPDGSFLTRITRR
jgi:uncharacterized protein (DUF2249 family)